MTNVSQRPLHGNADLPRVTIAIDAYNAERFLSRTIESALRQDYPASLLEVIVVDDGSTDSTPDIASQFEDRIIYVRKPNGGQASALNAGARRATGEIVCF